MHIHGLIYFVIGLGVTIASALIENLTIFIVVGIVFMAIGIIKLVLKPRKGTSTQHRPKEQQYITCHRCKAYNYPHSTLCHHCKQYLQSV